MDKLSSSSNKFPSNPKPPTPVHDRIRQKFQVFEDLANEFSTLETTEEIMNWDVGLRERLKTDKAINEYNQWSVNHFRAPSGVENISEAGGAKQLKTWLQNVSWKKGNREYELVSSMMQYGHRLPNKGLFWLGRYGAFWLVVRLNPWAISLPKTDPQLRKSYKDFSLGDEGVLGLRYKHIDDDTRKTLFFFPLGHILYAESSPRAKPPSLDVIEWMYTPYVVAVGIQSNNNTEVDDQTKEAKFYSIYSPDSSSAAGYTKAGDFDDDAPDIDLCHNPPPYSIARAQFPSKVYLTPNCESIDPERDCITFEPLSDSKDIPRIAETGLSGRNIRTGLFPL